MSGLESNGGGRAVQAESGTRAAIDALGDWLAQVVCAQPGRAALRFGPSTWTYSELWQGAARMAAAICDLPGYEPGCRIGLVGSNSPAYLAAYLGAIRAHAVVVPLNDRLDAQELHTQLEFVEAISCLIGAGDSGEGLALGDGLPTYALADLQPTNAAPFEPPDPDAPAVILLTSGSTGRPKGVVHSQRTLLHAALQMAIALPYGRTDVSIAFLPFFASMQEQVLPTLVSGGTLDVLEQFSVAEVCDACVRARSFDAVPTIMARLLDEGDHAELGRLQWVSFASEPMPPSLLQRWWDAFPTLQTFEFYGMTELLTITHATPELLADDPRTVGVAFPTSQVAIVDSDLRPVPPGVEGQVTCSSPARMLGYWNDAPATELALTADGAIRTGDIGTLDAAGSLHLTGRLKDLIISGGLNIAPAEIETVACMHPRVAAAAVVGIPDPRWGETPVIVAVPARGETLSEEEVLAHCRAKLASFKRPSAAVVVASLPVTGIGKSAKNELRQAILSGALELVRAAP
jgi:acyl-CoA synthetase (AMP-forming)/AMP-acid ligase II